MDTLEIVLLVTITGGIQAMCYYIGYKLAKKSEGNSQLTNVTVNPFKLYEKKMSKKKAKEESDRMEKILANIENYDGTSRGQIDV